VADHAILSPSSSHRWLECPGSVRANWGVHRESNEHALLGTSAHGLLEVCLRLGTQPRDHLGSFLAPGHNVVTEDMADAVSYALDYVEGYVANHPGTVVRVEQRLVIGPQVGCSAEECFGSGDITLTNKQEAVSVDYKHGTGAAVTAKDNTQLRMYLLGMRNERRYQRYRGVIVQPRLRGRKPVQEAPALSDNQLMAWANKVVRPIIPIALSDDAPRKAGKWCYYCADYNSCPARDDERQLSAQKEFASTSSLL
jgi:hypothetical protein